jgi:predicted nucleotidyltransferase
MKISKEQQREINKMFEEEQVSFAYLFGSQANGTAIKNSDVDIAVMFNKDIGENERFKGRLKLMSKMPKIFSGKKVEVVSLNDIRDILFKFAIVQPGKIIFKKDYSALLDFDLRTTNDYYDFKPFLKMYNEAYAERSLAE